MKKILTLLLITTAGFTFAQSLKSPDEFLGYTLGDRYTRHHEMIDYFRYVDAQMPNVQITQYGKTYEDRPLIYTVIASQENFAKLEEIRLDNLKRTGLISGTPSSNKIAIVWMSYNVHGNEASGMEAALKTLHELVSTNRGKEYLKNTVVIIDPCINPDGRDRFTNFNNQYINVIPNSSADAAENNEPWPRGRANHYLFDLNRDWAWLQQAESQARLQVYNQWMPHIHVDFHEQGFNSPYYFAPAAEPFHAVITNWQREFQTTIGKNNAKYFDEKGWLFFTKESFDLLYPSYGDTYPTYNGAIGMTYEQGGQRGVSIMTREGVPLTLEQRLLHHHTTGMSTVEVAAKNALVGTSKAGKGFDYQTQAQGAFTLSAEDIVVNTFQPKSRFITTVFEPQSKLSDSVTYDITAWNLFYAYNLKGYALTERINAGKAYEKKKTNASVINNAYAYIFKYESVKDAEFLGELLKRNFRVRIAQQAFTVNGNSFNAGTIIVTKTNNESIIDFDKVVQTLATNYKRTLYTSTTGFVDKGKDFGSSEVAYLEPPKVAMLMGDGSSSLSAGEVWHYFEQQLHYPITQIRTNQLRRTDLNQYNILIVPEGYYDIFDDGQLDRLNTWVSAGGKLIIIGDALESFSDKKGFSLKHYKNDESKKAIEKIEEEWKKKDGLIRYEDAERKNISENISGAIYKTVVDNSHPLAFGLGNHYFTLKTNTIRYDFMEDGWNVGMLKGAAKPVQGFAGYKANKKMDNTLSFGVQQKGRGNIVYFVDNPLFRCFWDQGKFVFGNAVFMVP
ncbi:MAG: zinc carboxypeptidase [Cytophagia bacterium]|nr:zinc carboxypeptidase [Cytophagia bacterium]